MCLLPSHRDHEWMVVSEEVNTDFVSLLSAVLESHVSQKIAGLVLKYYSSIVDLIFLGWRFGSDLSKPWHGFSSHKSPGLISSSSEFTQGRNAFCVSFDWPICFSPPFFKWQPLKPLLWTLYTITCGLVQMRESSLPVIARVGSRGDCTK